MIPRPPRCKPGVVRALLMVLACCLGCSSPTQEAYKRVARETAAVLVELKPVAAKFLAFEPHQHAEIIAACMSMDEPLLVLREVKLETEYILAPRDEMTAADIAEMLVDHRDLRCRRLDHPGWAERCSEFCLASWIGLIDSVERLRQAAKAEGVDIISLRP